MVGTPVRTTTNAAIYDVYVSNDQYRRMSNNITQNPKRVTAASATGLPRDLPYVASTAPQWDGTVPALFCSDGRVWDIHGILSGMPTTAGTKHIDRPGHG